MSLSPDDPGLLGIDLGGTKILAGVVDSTYGVRGRAKRSTPSGQGEQAILDALVECAREALTVAGVETGQLAGIGVGAPGTLDLDNGVIRLAPNLSVRDFPLASRLGEVLHLPVVLRNDVRAGGYGEFRLGAGRGYTDILTVFVGTGIGGCVIRDGKLFLGHTQNAGEIGHILAKFKGPKCGCGRRGCLEALASKTALAKRINRAVNRGETTPLREAIGKNGRLKSKDLAAAIDRADPVVVREVERMARVLGTAIGGLINLAPPELVLLGGGVTEALGDPFVARIKHWIHQQGMADPDHRVVVERTALGDDAGFLGAALLAREHFAASGGGGVPTPLP